MAVLRSTRRTQEAPGLEKLRGNCVCHARKCRLGMSEHWLVPAREVIIHFAATKAVGTLTHSSEVSGTKTSVMNSSNLACHVAFRRLSFLAALRGLTETRPRHGRAYLTHVCSLYPVIGFSAQRPPVAEACRRARIQSRARSRPVPAPRTRRTRARSRSARAHRQKRPGSAV